MLIESYAPQNREAAALYTRAKAEQWNPDTAINWQQEHVFEEFVDPEIGKIFNRAFVSQMYYGEQAALDVACAVTPRMASIEAKFCLAVQVADESRHVEVFGRYCEDLGGLYPMNPHLREIVHDLEQAETIEEQIIGMQLFLEGIALGAFRTKMKQTADPLLKEILRLVARDEARHTEFGIIYLEQMGERITPALREHLERRVARWWDLWQQSMRWRDDVVWPTVPKLARRLFNRQTTNNLQQARADLALGLQRLQLSLDDAA